MSSMLASTLRRAATQPKPAALGAIATNIRRNCVTDAPKPQGKGFKEAWLSDKGAWPVIGVIGFAIVFSSAFLLRTTITHPDVRINRKDRCSVVREKDEK